MGYSRIVSIPEEAVDLVMKSLGQELTPRP
jgi:hypothetical protein